MEKKSVDTDKTNFIIPRPEESNSILNSAKSTAVFSDEEISVLKELLNEFFT